MGRARTISSILLLAAWLALPGPAGADLIMWEFTATETTRETCTIEILGFTHGERCWFDELWGADRESAQCRIQEETDWSVTGDGCFEDEWGIYHCSCEGSTQVSYPCEDLAFDYLCNSEGRGTCGEFRNFYAPSMSLDDACSRMESSGMTSCSIGVVGLARPASCDENMSNCSIGTVGLAEVGLATLLLIVFLISMAVARRAGARA